MNLKQIQNIKRFVTQENKSHDALYGLHLLVNQLNNYIVSIKNNTRFGGYSSQ